MGERHEAPPRARLLRLLGVTAGGVVYLAYAVCWAIAVLRTQAGPAGVLPALLYAAGEVLAVLAAPAWFAACLVLPRTALQRAGWMAAGLVILAPVPLLLGVA